MASVVTPSGAAKVALATTVALLGLSAGAAGQWPQWRGPTRDGSVATPPRGDEWPERPVLLWEREVGEGYSGPVVARDRVWVHAREGRQEVVSSLALDSGKELWSRHDAVLFEQDPSAGLHGRGPYATPSLADGRLFTLGITAVLSAWDAATGALLWRTDYSAEFDPSHTYFGASASPLVWGGLCFVHFGGQREEALGRPGKGAMVALSVAEGRERWRWTGDSAGLGASPVVQVIGGQPHLAFKARASIVGVDPHTGRELWRIPFPVDMENTIVTPLFVGDVLVTSDYQKGMHAWRIQRKGHGWTTQELWRHREVSLFTSSPVVAGGQVIGFSEFKRGQLFGLNPRDGRVLWRSDGRWGDHASLIAWGNQVLVFREDGSLVVGDLSGGRFQELRRYRLGGRLMWGHPAVVDDRIVVKDGSRLAVYQIGPSEPTDR
jgi:outer membrane protein assembly factor BamB